MSKLEQIINEMYSDLGVKQGSQRHMQIIDGYNQIQPLPEGYKVKYTDSWCMTYISYLLHKYNIKCEYECSVERFTKKNKKHVLTNYEIGSIICYDWNDNNWLDHVGIIVDIDNQKDRTLLKVIEGNYNKQVAVRNIYSDSKYIKKYISINKMITGDNKKIKKEK